MAKKTYKKVYKKASVKKGKWYQLSIFRFSIASVVVLAALAILAGGLYHILPKGPDVLGAKTSSYNRCMVITSDDIYQRKCEMGYTTSSSLPSGLYYDSTKCIPDMPINYYYTDQTGSYHPEYCQGLSHTIYVKVVDASNSKKLTLFKGYKIKLTTSLIQMPSKTVTVDSNGNAQFPNQYGGSVTSNTMTITPSSDLSVAYQFSPSSWRVSPGLSGVFGECEGTKNNPCIFKVKIVALPSNLHSRTCVTKSMLGVCNQRQQLCTQVTNSCQPQKASYVNCASVKGKCGVPSSSVKPAPAKNPTNNTY